MVEKKQKMRYSDAELSLIKNTFAENDELMKAIRKFFLQMPLDVIDQQILENIKSKKEVLAVIRKSFLPELDPNAPIHQIVDLWLTVDMKDKTPEDAYPAFVARDILIKYLEAKLSELEGKESEPAIDIKSLTNIEGKDAVTVFANILARNTLLSHTEMQISQFLLLAGLKDEAVEKTLERLKRDSAK